MDRVWYEHGLRFQCQPGCSNCCGGAPGYVWVNDAEQQALAAELGLSVTAFARKYVRRLREGHSLRERRNYDCILLDRDLPGCTVYAARPRQCRTFPFWPENLVSRQAWLRLRDECPGIECGRWWSRQEIDAMMQSTAGPGSIAV